MKFWLLFLMSCQAATEFTDTFAHPLSVFRYIGKRERIFIFSYLFEFILQFRR